jgi:hypothetical protein
MKFKKVKLQLRFKSSGKIDYLTTAIVVIICICVIARRSVQRTESFPIIEVAIVIVPIEVVSGPGAWVHIGSSSVFICDIITRSDYIG